MSLLQLFLGFCVFGCIAGHGRLALPPSRSSSWQFGYSTPINYNDWELNCGGYQVRLEI